MSRLLRIIVVALFVSLLAVPGAIARPTHQKLVCKKGYHRNHKKCVKNPAPVPAPQPSPQPAPSPPKPTPVPTSPPTPESPVPPAPPVEEHKVPTRSLHCFFDPVACGFPAPATTGVPAGTVLASSGGITITTNGTVVNAREITGSINIVADNVTIKNSKIIETDSCGANGPTCGNYAIRVDENATGVLLEDDTFRSAPGATCEHSIRNTSSSIVVGERLDLQACDADWYGNGLLKDSYGTAKEAIKGDHIENVYVNDGTFTAEHDTLLNPIDQTAVIFANVGNGQGGTCINRITATNSLLVGGGYSFYPCGNSDSVGANSLTKITGNHFARCLTPEHQDGGGGHICSSGADANGYWPLGGHFGLLDGEFGATHTVSGNVWDDNGANAAL